jgi:beta-lactamase superfamily II metal-dependent hydrolase
VQSVLDELVADGMRVYRTDRAGDVTVTFRGRQLLVDTG